MDALAIVFDPAARPIAAAFVAVAVTATLVEAALLRTRTPVPWPLWAVRIAAVVAVGGLLGEVAVQIERHAPARKKVALLLDTSASMALGEADTRNGPLVPRYERVARALGHASLDAFRARGIDLVTFGFDRDLEPLEADPFTHGTPPAGAGSDLAAALGELLGPEGMPDLAAAVVVSDGRVEGGDRNALAASARDLGVPVTTVAAGGRFPRDVWVAAVSAPPFAFVENVVEIDAHIEAQGLPPDPLVVTLRRDGEEVDRTTIATPRDGAARRVRFSVAPSRVGTFVYEVALEGPANQGTAENDRRIFVLKVLRDKVRVLHVAGRPDWDVRALRMLLRRDPNVELLSYYILRDLDDILRDPAPPEELSLIPFPTDELFSEELGSFDLVILQNFDLHRHQVARYLPNIADYVEQGGALVVIGGDLGLAQAAYAHPAFARILPVDVTRPSPLRMESVTISITRAGRAHPITAPLLDPTGDLRPLPALTDRNAIRMAPRAEAVGGRVLLRGNGEPLLVAAEPGKGRVVVLATASSWRLGFAPDLAYSESGRPYDRLFLGTVAWLLREAASDRLRVETDRPQYAPGAPVTVAVTALSADYAPAAGVRVDVRISAMDRPTASGPSPGAVRSFLLETGDAGRARTVVRDLAPGAYTVEATRAGSEGDAAESVRRVFLVAPPRQELADVDPRPGADLLKRLAEATGGRFVDLARENTIPDEIPTREPPARTAARVQAIPLWNHPLYVSVAALLLCLEWLLRRRLGLA